MNLYEYQGKEILKYFGGNIQRGFVISDPEEAINIAQKLSKETGTKLWVIKAQIDAGGRGKSGGIKIAKSLEEVQNKSLEMLGMQIITPQTGKNGKIVRKIMIAEDVYYTGHFNIKEYYISILFDRDSGKDMIMYSNEGGVDIESISNHHSINREYIDPILGIQKFHFRNIAFNLKIHNNLFQEFINFIKSLYKSYKESDALLFEINPLLKTSNNKFIAVDAKVIIDDNALFRHNYNNKDHEENPIEAEAMKYGLNFIKLNGNVACMVNGAGLAMATMDMIKLSGGNPANFLDIGGTADIKRVEKALHIILKDSNVKIILINIFGGIVRCERVALGIVNAYSKINNIHIPPIIIRLQGTNFEYAKKILDESEIAFYSVNTLYEAAIKINHILKS